MATGVNYRPTKNDLLEKIKSNVFPNKKFAVTAANLQQVLLDMTESMWDDLVGSGGPNIINLTTYGDLTTHITNNTLLPGTWYTFPYESIHLIGGTTAVYNNTTLVHDDGTGVSSTFTPEVETFMALAIDTNKIHTEVHSLSYPMDRIYYDVDDNKTEDGLIDRPGFVHYREDTELGLVTGYDFRNVLHRRFVMDEALDRSGGWDTYVARVGTTDDFLASRYTFCIPSRTIFSGAGNSTNIGGFVTPSTGTPIDYLTFVGLGSTDLFTTEGPSYRNIKILNSGEAAVLAGSATGTVDLESTKYGRLGNTVFFCKSAQNIEVGGDASGVHIGGAVVRNVKIGNNVQNIIIGGPQGSPQYTTTVPEIDGYSENIEIKDSSRDVATGDLTKNMVIGYSNIGVLKGNISFNLEVGNFNNEIFFDMSENITVGDFNKSVFFELSTNMTLEDANTNFRVRQSVGGTAPTSSSNNIPTSVDNTEVLFLTGTALDTVGSANKNIYLYQLNGFDMGSGCEDVYIRRCDSINIGNKLRYSDFESVFYADIGDACEYIELGGGILKVNIGQQCSRVVATGSDISIGTGCADIAILRGSSAVAVGERSSQIYMMGSVGVKIGQLCNTFHLRGSSTLSFGDNVVNVFMESSSSNSIGNDCSDITFNNVGLRYEFALPSMNNFMFNNQETPRSTRVFKDVTAVLLTQLLSIPGIIAPAQSLGSGCSGVTIGNKCETIYMVTTVDVDIEDRCSSISLGTHDVSTNNISQTFDGSGDPIPFDVATANANMVFDGNSANKTSFGANCSNIRVIGLFSVGFSDNIFGEYIKDIYTDPTFSFKNNRILVNPNFPLTPLTQAYSDKYFDRKDSLGDIWHVPNIPLEPFTTSTTGATIINGYYIIENYIAGDDFTNIGAPSNATGVSFKATGPAPTVWTNGSTLRLSGGSAYVPSEKLV